MSLTVWPQPWDVPPEHAQDGFVEVRLPPLDELAERWFVIAPLLRKSTVRNGCYEPIDLLRLSFAGQAGIWVCEIDGGIEAAFVTWIKDYPRRRVLEIVAGGGGGMKAWLDPLKAALDAHARESGCSHIASVARPGWVRAWGAEPTGDIQMVRNIEDAPR
jgi:hypothetical protein